MQKIPNVLKSTLILLWIVYFTFLLTFYFKFNYVQQPRDWIYVILLLFLFGLASTFFVMARRLKILPSREWRPSVSTITLIAYFFISLSAVNALFLLYFTGSSAVINFFIALYNSLLIIVVHFLFAVTWYLLGRRILSLFKLHIRSVVGNTILAMVFGQVATIFLFYAITVLGVLSGYSVVLYFIISFIVGRKYFRSVGKLLTHRIKLHIGWGKWRDSKIVTALLAVLFTYSILIFVSTASFRPADTDSVKTYFYIPYQIVQSGGFFDAMYLPLNNAPLSSSFLYIPYIYFGELQTNQLNIIFLWLLVGSIYYVASKYISRRVALYSCLLFLSMDMIFLLTATLKSEYLLMLVVFWSAVLLLRASDQHEKFIRIITAAGMLFGVSISIKYNVLLFIPALLLYIVFFRKGNVGVKLFAAFIFSASAAIAYAPWGLRNIALFGQLFYPYSLTGSYDQVTSLAAAMRNQFNHELTAYTHLIQPGNSLLRNIFYLASNQTNYAYNKFGPLIFSLIPLVFIRKISRFGFKLLLFVAPTVIFWYIAVVSQVWYILYIFPFLIIFLASYWDRVLIKVQKIVLTSVVILLLLINIRPHNFNLAETLFAGDYNPSEVYTEATIEFYINTDLITSEGNYLILPFGEINSLSIRDHYRHVIDNDFMIAWIPFIAEDESNTDIIQAMQEAKITHIFVQNDLLYDLENSECNTTPCPTVRYVINRIRQFERDLIILEQTDAWILYQLPSIKS